MLATGLVASIAAWFGGADAALSALCGGAVSTIGGVAFYALARPSGVPSAGTAVLSVLRAEAVKVVVIIALLWAALTLYKDIVATVFIGTFVLAVLIQSMAIFVRDQD